MATPVDNSLDRTARIREVIDDCLVRRAGGEAVADDSLVAAHPQLMPELREELGKLRTIAAARLQARRADDYETRTFGSQHTQAVDGLLEVRCPSCHTPLDVEVDTPFTDLTCDSCGSHFSLIDPGQKTHMSPTLTTMGRFELVERLGVGACGTVWKARDNELDRTVAVKVPRRGNMTPEDIEKFFREARAAAQLRHPNIVSVHEVGRDGDSVFIVSDFVRGVTLGDWLTGQQLTSREAAERCVTIANALHHAHERGVIHRDLKPANIMIDGEGEPHIMDFGLARRDVGEATVTIEGQILGTPAYMSPEQAAGESHKADRRSDVYSVGVILFQLLTGELPFRGNPRMLIHQVIHDHPMSPRKLVASVPRDLETIVLKCLEKNPSQRYQTADELAAELRRYLSNHSILAKPCGVIGRTIRWYGRNPNSLSLTAGGYTAILGVILLLWSFCGIAAGVMGWDLLSPQAMIEIAFLAIVFYPLTIAMGLATLSGSLFGLVGGFILALGWLTATLLIGMNWLQLASMPTHSNQPYQHFQLASLLGLLALIAAVLFGAALIARVVKSSALSRLH